MPAATKNKGFQGPPAKTYEQLVAAMPPRPLHDQHEYDNAVEMVGRLAGYDLNRDQEDYLEALAVFIQRYETDHGETQVDTGNITGLDTLRSLLDDYEMGAADLSRLLGVSRSLGAMILRGERSLTAAHARTLGDRFKLDPGVFIR